jgi:hypothetical protein
MELWGGSSRARNLRCVWRCPQQASRSRRGILGITKVDRDDVGALQFCSGGPRALGSRTKSWQHVFGRGVVGSSTHGNTTVFMKDQKSEGLRSECPCSDIINRSSSTCRSPAQTRGSPDTWSTVRPQRWNKGSPLTCGALSLAGHYRNALHHRTQEQSDDGNVATRAEYRQRSMCVRQAPSCARVNLVFSRPIACRELSVAVPRLSAPVRLPLQCVKHARAQTKQPRIRCAASPLSSSPFNNTRCLINKQTV